MPGEAEQVEGGFDGAARMVCSGNRGDVQADGFVSNQPLDKRVRPDQNVRSRQLEAVHQATELIRSQLLCQPSRAAHVREKHSQFDDRATGMLETIALLAKTRVVARLVPAHHVHDKTTPAFERRVADFAARAGGKQPY